jgi:molecular chaperone GrpE
MDMSPEEKTEPTQPGGPAAGAAPESSPPPPDAASAATDDAATPEAADVTPSPGEIAELRRKAAEYDALLDRLKRVTAEYINSQRRMERDMQERVRYAIESFARELLPIADNLGRALAATRETPSVEKLVEGVDMVEKNLYAIFDKHGIRPVSAETGAAFDPALHEAIAAIESAEHKPGSILQQTQKGFHLHDRLLRPASVVVSKASPKP